MKLKHFIATHTFHSDKVKRNIWSLLGNEKKNADWFENVPKREDAQLHQLFIGKADFFFCHWYAESENAIIETLSEAGADQYMITMATEVGVPKIDLDKMTMLMGKIK